MALFALVITGWVSGRAVLWEPPERPAFLAAAMPAHKGVMPPPAAMPEPASLPLGQSVAVVAAREFARSPAALSPPARPRPRTRSPARLVALPIAPPVVRPISRLIPRDMVERSLPSALAQTRPLPSASAPLSAGGGPWLPATPRAERWSFDAWGFYRQGSDAAPISQGRVPIYGASQLGAIAQFRLAPAARRDPRLYLRAYQALVTRGESEVSLGGSIRPFPSIPLRAFAELRYTDAPFARQLRPSLFVVSELPPQALPAGFTLEAYGQAGWVGGDFKTPFTDGQASLARELARFTAPGGVPLRLSAGAGVWGGAQKGAERLDVGPTLRVEWTMGRVPARLSIDWREQVAGDAAPQSGIAATLSTSF